MMNPRAASNRKQGCVWYITIPKQQEFTEPKFHFGHQVCWQRSSIDRSRDRQIGRIIGMQFIVQTRRWQYQILMNNVENQLENDSNPIDLMEEELMEVQTVPSIQPRFEPSSDWLSTSQAAARLGISAEQLRRLRREGLFKVGHHCRDTSIPGSGLPRWQWHLARCEKALAVPPTQRSNK